MISFIQLHYKYKKIAKRKSYSEIRTSNNECEMHGLSTDSVVKPTDEAAGIFTTHRLQAEQTTWEQPRAGPQGSLLDRDQLFVVLTEPPEGRQT